MDNYIEYIANGTCNSFQNIFYTAAEGDLVVTVNSVEIPSIEYTWLYGTKYVQLDATPNKDDRVRITNTAYVSDPDPDIELMRNDISNNTANITALEAEQDVQDAALLVEKARIDALELADVDHDSSINDLSTQYNTHESRLDQIDVDLNIVEAKAQQNLEDIALLSDQGVAVTALEGRMDSAEATIIVLQGNIVDINTAIDALRDEVASLRNAYGENIASGYVPISNEQLIGVDITNGAGDQLLLDADACYSARMYVEYERITDDSTRHTEAEYLLQYNKSNQTWYISRTETKAIDGDHDGVTLAITTNPVTKVGSISYTSDNHTGANYDGVMRWRLDKMIHTI